jgi:DNA-binding XRE family transcriptional regulator
MRFKIRYGDEVLPFPNLFRLTIEFGGKAWCYDQKHSNDNQLSFKVVKLGYAGLGNWLKQWRKRGRLKKMKASTANSQEGRAKQRREFQPLTQTDAAKILGVSQPFIANVENERKPMPVWMYRRILGDVHRYGRLTIPPDSLKRRPRQGIRVIPKSEN